MKKLLSIFTVLFAFMLLGVAMAADPIKRITGKVVDFSSPAGVSTATLDAFAFGFESQMVRLCVKPATTSVPMYFRFATATADVSVSTETSYTNTGTNYYIASDYATDRMTAPASSSTVFIAGQTGTYAFGRAIPMRIPALGADDALDQFCVTEPWQTKGIVSHIASGIATVDIWAW
jgi:hypothetical protein